MPFVSLIYWYMPRCLPFYPEIFVYLRHLTFSTEICTKEEKKVVFISIRIYFNRLFIPYILSLLILIYKDYDEAKYC